MPSLFPNSTLTTTSLMTRHTPPLYVPQPAKRPHIMALHLTLCACPWRLHPRTCILCSFLYPPLTKTSHGQTSICYQAFKDNEALGSNWSACAMASGDRSKGWSGLGALIPISVVSTVTFARLPAVLAHLQLDDIRPRSRSGCRRLHSDHVVSRASSRAHTSQILTPWMVRTRSSASRFTSISCPDVASVDRVNKRIDYLQMKVKQRP